MAYFLSVKTCAKKGADGDADALRRATQVIRVSTG
jgi:hypothetical protein